MHRWIRVLRKNERRRRHIVSSYLIYVKTGEHCLWLYLYNIFHDITLQLLNIVNRMEEYMFTSIDTISLHSYTFFRHNYVSLYKWDTLLFLSYTFTEISINDQIGTVGGCIKKFKNKIILLQIAYYNKAKPQIMNI